jgi:hypothetical protein
MATTEFPLPEIGAAGTMFEAQDAGRDGILTRLRWSYFEDRNSSSRN